MKAEFPPLGIIPILAPVEQIEKLLADEYVRQSVPSRLSSRHFRNQLRLLREGDELAPFLEWAMPWLGELSFDTLVVSPTLDGPVVQTFFFEMGSRVPKEVVWAGDGIQVWLQLLYHIHRVRYCDTIVLDEPEVYLHPDLQRRLVHLLESTGRQVVLATHSTEVITESDGRLTILVDKSRKRAIRAKTDADYEMLTSALGTAFNLRLSRALRSRVAVFVEGQDMAVLRRFAHTLGLMGLEGEVGITVIPLKGYSHWGQVEPFKWLLEELLPNAMETFVILDRDYRTQETCDAVEQTLANASIRAHVWKRKELESYLLTASVAARISGAPVNSVVEWLADIADTFETDVFSRLLDDTMRAEVGAQNHAVSVTAKFKESFDLFWADPENRLFACPPKQVISALNEKFQAAGFKAVSTVGLARGHWRSEIPVEIELLLREIEAAANSN